MTENNAIIICFLKINHLLRQEQEKITIGVFLSFRVVVTVYLLNESDLPVAFRFHVSVLTNQISNHLWSNYKWSLHISAEQKTNLHLHSQLVRSVVESNLWIDEGSGSEVGGSYYGVQTKENLL